MSLLAPRTLALAVTAAALVLPAPALAGWAPATTVFDGSTANPQAVAAGGGGVLLGSFIDDRVRLAARSGTGGGIGPAQAIYAPVAFERVWTSAVDGAGDAVILTVRKHRPYQRVRVVLAPHDGAAGRPRTLSAKGHSATQPMLSLAADGSAVAAWAWHDKPGWRVQAALRPPGGDFGPAVTLSDPDPTRPWIEVAAGRGGGAAIAWQFGGSYQRPDEPLHVAGAAAGQAFAAPQTLSDAGGHADLALAVSPAGHVVLAFSPTYYLARGEREPSRLLVAEGEAGGALSAPAQLASGPPGIIDGAGPVAAFTGSGDTLVGWVARTGGGNEQGGRAELYTKPAGADAFGAPQVLSADGIEPRGLVLATGEDGRAVAAWWQSPHGAPYPTLSIHAAVRGAAGGAFGTETRVNPDGEIGLWPTAAITPSGDAILTWVHNTDGSGGGQVEAAVLPAG